MTRNVPISVIVMFLCCHVLVPQAVQAEEGGKLKTIKEIVKDAHEGVDYIGIDDMKKRIKSNSRLVLLDVRTQREYDAAHLKGSSWVERGVAEFVLVRTLPDPKAEIVVYCKKGNRAGLVVKALKRAGYINVVGLQGGFDEWTRQGNTVQNFLGEFKLVKLGEINASSWKVDLFQDKD